MSDVLATDECRSQSTALRVGSPTTLTLAGVNVVDVVHETVRKKSITISGGRIAKMSDGRPNDQPDIDLDGCWAVPSMVDMHAHVTFEARTHFGVPFSCHESAQLGQLRAVQNLTEAMLNGICLVRDVGGRQEHLSAARKIVSDGGLLLPELVTSGEPLCRPGGHGSSFGQHVVSLSTELDQLVTRHVTSGHEWLKVMHGPELWPEPELAEIVTVAHRHNLKVAIHAFTAEGVGSAVRAGADTVEHGMASDPKVIAEARELGTQFVPTAYCSWISLRPRFTYTQSMPEIRYLEQWFEYLELCQPPHVDSGLPLLPGTDAGCAPCSFNDYLEELKRFEQWGLDSMAVLCRATIDSARCIGRAEHFGSIDVGKWANIIVTERDPTIQVAALRQPVLILLKGADVMNKLGERWS